MKRLVAFVAALWAASPVAFCGASSRAVNQAQVLKVRLETHLTSYATKPGSPFRAIVIAPYRQNGRIVIPRDSQVLGVVRRATRVGIGLKHERARLDLSFQEIELPDGTRFPIRATLVSIDNARETVDPRGEIKGVLAARYTDGFLNGIWFKADPTMAYRSLFGITGVANLLWQRVGAGPFGAAALVALRCSVLSFPEPEIHLPPGADMNLVLETLPANLPSFPIPSTGEVPAALASWLQSQPRAITRPNGPVPDDMINMAFIGSAEQLQGAFKDSGWFIPEQSGVRSFSRFYAALNAMRSYPTAPASALLYRGSLPDFRFERSLNTVSKRDHVRIWRAGSFENQDLWLGAAIHDRGITFRLSTFKFTHEIDNAIDKERSNVVNDLAFAGCSQPVSYFSAPLPEGPALRDGIITDGRIAVVFLNQCSKPPLAVDTVAPKPPGNQLTRLTRRLILETRNYILRDNPAYLGYQIVQWRRGAR